MPSRARTDPTRTWKKENSQQRAQAACVGTSSAQPSPGSEEQHTLHQAQSALRYSPPPLPPLYGCSTMDDHYMSDPDVDLDSPVQPRGAPDDAGASPPASPGRPKPQRAESRYTTEEARDEALRRELEQVRGVNKVIEDVIESLEKAKGNMHVSTRRCQLRGPFCPAARPRYAASFFANDADFAYRRPSIAPSTPLPPSCKLGHASSLLPSTTNVLS